MLTITVDLKGVLKKLTVRKAEAKAALKMAMEDITDDLVRVSSEIAPHDKGILEKAHEKEIVINGFSAVSTVSYSVREANKDYSFNYALWMHEGTYNLGPGSLAKPGTEGMSGTHYDVGPKYLTRPLEGEQATYKDHIKKVVGKAVRGE
jgi:hypothetical protein